MAGAARPLALLGLLAPTLALATPLIDSHVGSIGFAGPTSGHVSSIFWNPAAMAQLEGTRVLLVGTARLDSTTIDRDTIDQATGEPSPSGSKSFPELVTHVLSPNGFLGAVKQFSIYRVGMALYSPYAERLPPAAPELAYHTEGGHFYLPHAVISVAIRGSSSFMIGVGLNFALAYSDLRFARDLALEQPESCTMKPCPKEEPANAQHYRILSTDSSLALGFNVGLLVRIPTIHKLFLGVAYTSPPTTDVPSFAFEIQKSGEATVSGAATASGESRMTFRLPQMLHVGLRYDLSPQNKIMLNFRWLDLSTHKGYDLRLAGPELSPAGAQEWRTLYRGFQDAFSLEGGLEATMTPNLRLGGRLRLESSAVETSRVGHEQVDAPKIDLGLGAEMRMSTHMFLSLGYSLAYLLPQDVAPSAFSPSESSRCVASDFDLDICQAAREGRAIPTAAGHYERLSHELLLGLVYEL